MYWLVFTLLFFSIAQAKEVFTEDKIFQYLSKDNPYIYSAIGKEAIYAGKEKFILGNFDTQLSAKYDNKNYPTTTGKYTEISLNKPIENGIELNAGYRKSEGTQEYNNIKTGSNGEAIVGVKIPVFSVLNDMNKQKLALKLATLDTIKSKFEAQNNLRLLYFQILSHYNQLLYSSAVLDLENKLLQKAKRRKHIIAEKVKIGDIAQMELLEAQQQVINREQRHLSAQTLYTNTKRSLLKYLNISKENFDKQYTLPHISKLKYKETYKTYSLNQVINNRADLKVLNYEIQKISLQEINTKLLQYPKFNVSLYGVHDFKYDNGFKISLDMSFPLERRQYEGMYAQNKNEKKLLQKKKDKKIMEIRTNLANLLISLDNISKNIDQSKQEVILVKKLESLENEKYILGSSNLFVINQREVYTLEIKIKLLNYYRKYMILMQKVKRELGQINNLSKPH